MLKLYAHRLMQHHWRQRCDYDILIDMKDGNLLKDGAIVLVVVAIAVLIYLVYPQQQPQVTKQAPPTAKELPTAQPQTNLTANKNTMQPESDQLKVEVIKEGTGVGAAKGQSISVDYTGKLTDGTVFDSSIPRGQPFTLVLGGGQVIPGWEMGLLGMKVGEQRRLTIPPALAYGKNGIGGVIPPNATLIFDVEMKSIK